MWVRVLGDLEVEVAGALVDLGGPKPRALFALLVAGDGHPVSVERLVDQVWESAPPARVEASLQSYVARLRRAVGRDTLRTHAGGYSLDLAGADVDARRFAEVVDRARTTARTDPAAAADQLGEALGLWRGPAYSGFTAPILRAEAVRLEELRLAATGDRWGLRLALGEHRAAVPELEQLVRLHPLHERFWALLARALYADARQGDALAALRRAREQLAEDLGVDPGAELRDLERAILRQDPALTPPAPSTAVVVAPPPGIPEPPPLPGRAEALRQAEEAIEAAATAGRVVLVAGEAGIGKSRLAQELVRRARAAGLRTGWGGWEPAPSPALWGWSRALGDAVGGEPELDAAGADAAAASFRQAQRVLELLADAPTLLVLDDVQWADAESLRLLSRVAWGLRSVPAVLVVTVRTPAETTADTTAEVADALGTLARTEPLRLDLTGLDIAGVARCVEAQSGREVSHAAVAELARRTDGNPLYLAEMVRYLVAAGALDEPGDPAWARVPSGVRDVVRHRLVDLPEDWTTVLGTAATIGREFDLALLERVHGDPDEVAAALEAAQMRGLVEDAGEGRARFSHALVRDALYDSVPARARRHAAVAHAGEELYAGRIAEHAGDLADHYRLAGRAHARAAWLLAETASHRAAERSAHDEAAQWLDSARRLQLDDPLTTDRERERVLRALARERVRRGHPIGAWEPAAAAARSALAGDRPEDAAASLLTVTEGLVWGWREAATWDDEAIAVWRRVLDANPGATITRARLTAALAMEHLYRPGSTAEGTRLADEAARFARELDPSAETLVVLQLAHTALLRPELLHHRGSLAEDVIALATAQRSDRVLAGALSARAQDRAELGRWRETRSDVARAFEIAEREGLPQALIVAGWCESTILLAAGDEEGAERRIAAGQRLQDRLEDASRGIDLGHLAMLRDAQGRLAELEPVLGPLRHGHPAHRELHALALARSGDLERLRLLLGSWADQPPITRDYSWLFLTAVRAETWAALGDREAAADLYTELAPYADRLAVTLAMGLRGAVAHWLGRLAVVLGEREAAREHLAAALRTHEALDMPLWVRRTGAALEASGGRGAVDT